MRLEYFLGRVIKSNERSRSTKGAQDSRPVARGERGTYPQQSVVGLAKNEAGLSSGLVREFKTKNQNQLYWFRER